MKKKIILFNLIMCIGIQVIFAQNIRITGTVTEDETGQPMPGVTIKLQGTSQGTATDMDGTYSIQVPGSDAVLEFSFVGYTPQEITVGNRTTINVSMVESLQKIDDVIVVAYGTASKVSFTGSAAAIQSKEIEKVPVTSFEKTLEGNVAGVTVAETSGQPGSGTEIRIRGRGSFSASNSPLYVIDGVPMTTGVLYEGGNLLATLNPNDIDNITVLKDAAAASLYGSRAANGVVIITTKKGTSGDTKYSLKSSYGISDFAVDNYPPASGDEFVELMRESLVNYYGEGAPEVQANMVAGKYYEPEGGYVDWYDLLFRKGKLKTTDLSASGGNDKTTFYVSASILDQQGLPLNSDFLRYSGRLNLKQKISDKINFGVNLMNAVTDQDVANNGSAYNNPFYNVNRNTFPTESPYDENGDLKYELDNAGYYNLLREYPLMERSAKVWRSMSTGFLEIKPIESLTLKSTNSYDFVNSQYKEWYSPLSRSGEDEHGIAYKRNTQVKKASTSNLATFDKTFQDQHHVNVIAAFEAESYTYVYFSAEGEGLPNESLRVLSVTANPVSASGYTNRSTMISYLSRANYDFGNKYFFSGSVRRDGSSRLGVNERWANFWSVSGAWRLIEEGFMSNINFLSDLKLKASYGTSGNLPGGLYDHLALYSYTGSYDGMGAAVEDQIASPNLTWEKNKTFNIGLDFGILTRINASVQYFKRNTSDLLLNLRLAPTVGAGSTMVNIGEMENKGIEFELRTDNVIAGNFRWSSTLLVSSVRNKILKLNNGEDIISGRYIHREGLPYWTFYLPVWAGVDPADGSPMFYVVTEDGEITDEVVHDGLDPQARKAAFDSPEPDIFGSISNDFSYKGFTLSFMFNYAIGGKIWYNSGYKSWNDGRSPKYVIPKEQVDRWQKPGDIAAHPQRIWTGNNHSDERSTRFLLDNNYLRLKNLSLSYTIPETLVSKIRLSNARIYVEGRNLLTFAEQDVVDPEHGGASGYAYFELPPVKTITFGLNIGF
ncbi:MAG TPA: TonB-dependent receptor [Bacteroidales bacterium]|nr:TonB-dependent receptor [Bacteroidales bacterium]